MFMIVKQASEKWGISDRRIRVLCSEGKIPGAYQEGRGWKIPVDAKKPADGRYKSKESLLVQIDRKKVELDSRRPLTAGEVARLNEEFIVEYTYNSNAIEGNTLTLRETDLVLRGLTIDQKPLKDHMESVGHKEAFDFVSEPVRDNVPISESIIKQIHYFVLADKKEDRGVYRRVPVRINLELMKAGFPPIDIKFTDRISYYNALDEYHVKHNLSAMENLFAGYINARLDMYLDMLQD